LTTKLTLTVTLTLTDTVKLISQTKLGGELLPECPEGHCLKAYESSQVCMQFLLLSIPTPCQSHIITMDSASGRSAIYC